MSKILNLYFLYYNNIRIYLDKLVLYIIYFQNFYFNEDIYYNI